MHNPLFTKIMQTFFICHTLAYTCISSFPGLCCSKALCWPTEQRVHNNTSTCSLLVPYVTNTHTCGHNQNNTPSTGSREPDATMLYVSDDLRIIITGWIWIKQTQHGASSYSQVTSCLPVTHPEFNNTTSCLLIHCCQQHGWRTTDGEFHTTFQTHFNSKYRLLSLLTRYIVTPTENKNASTKYLNRQLNGKL